jgi:hypothetical protein
MTEESGELTATLSAPRIGHHQRNCGSEDKTKYGKNVLTKLMAKELKGLHCRHSGEQGREVKTNHQILRSDS